MISEIVSIIETTGSLEAAAPLREPASPAKPTASPAPATKATKGVTASVTPPPQRAKLVDVIAPTVAPKKG